MAIPPAKMMTAPRIVEIIAQLGIELKTAKTSAEKVYVNCGAGGVKKAVDKKWPSIKKI
jgi:hypothetical protein